MIHRHTLQLQQFEIWHDHISSLNYIMQQKTFRSQDLLILSDNLLLTFFTRISPNLR